MKKRSLFCLIRVRSKRSGVTPLVARLAVIAFLIGLAAPAALAQQPEEPAPPEVAAAMTARAEEFLKAVAKLSPMPADTYPDLAQAWPRASKRRFFFRDENRWQEFDRDQTVKVVRHPTWGMPGTGTAWKVQYYGREIDISVDAVTGVIRSCHDNVLSGALSFEPARDVSQCISIDAAVSRATQYVQAAGINLNEFVLESALFGIKGFPTTAGDINWDVRWRRVWQGVPFKAQGISVTLDAGYGRLLWFGAALSIQPPAVARLDVLPDDAAEIAKRFLAERGRPVIDLLTATLQIVLPTDFWTSGEDRVTKRDPNSRLAWIIQYSVEDPHPPRWAEVWVDAATGEVIGGNVWGVLGKAPPTPPGTSIMRTLGFAKRLELHPLAPDQGQVRALDAKSDPLKFYGALSLLKLPKSDDKTIKCVPTHRLTATLADGKQVTFDYDAKTGRIGDTEGQIVQAGTLLRALLDPPKSSSIPAKR